MALKYRIDDDDDANDWGYQCRRYIALHGSMQLQTIPFILCAAVDLIPGFLNALRCD